MTQLPLRHPRDEALLHGFAEELGAAVAKHGDWMQIQKTVMELFSVFVRPPSIQVFQGVELKFGECLPDALREREMAERYSVSKSLAVLRRAPLTLISTSSGPFFRH